MAELFRRWVPQSVKERVRSLLPREVDQSADPGPEQVEPTSAPVVETSVQVVETVREVPVLDYEQVLAAPYLTAVGVVSEPDARDLAFPPFAPRAAVDGELSVPPRELWTVATDFLESGQRDAARIITEVEAAGLTLGAGTKVLDFGCGPGRVLRWLPHEIDGWGVDLNADRIAWCQSALSPPFRFATCGTYPHLPFADGTFELIYAGSVFTHLSELADTWLLELLRITAPGGLLYLTIHDQGTVAFCRTSDPESATRALTGFAQPPEIESKVQRWFDELGTAIEGFTFGRGYFAQVFYDRDALVRHWSRYAEVVSVVPAAFALHQTAVVLRRDAEE